MNWLLVGVVVGLMVVAVIMLLMLGLAYAVCYAAEHEQMDILDVLGGMGDMGVAEVGVGWVALMGRNRHGGNEDEVYREHA